MPILTKPSYESGHPDFGTLTVVSERTPELQLPTKVTRQPPVTPGSRDIPKPTPIEGSAFTQDGRMTQ
jgi:hypothetical protein